MGLIRHLIFLWSILLFGCKTATSEKPLNVPDNRPSVSFTFDDGTTNDIANFKFEEWNGMLLSHLENEKLKALFFVTGKNKLDQKGQFLLQSWDAKGHQIANHSLTHPNFQSEKNTSSLFEQELLRTDSLISKFNNHIKLFRFPYLKEGQNRAKVDSLRTILAKYGYSNGYVTIDASDWHIDQRLVRRIKKVGFDRTEIEKFRDFYTTHLLERANYYEKLSYELNKRHIHHTLLLHHNLTSALFLGDLIESFKEAGWNVIGADEAYQDRIFKQIPSAQFAGESLIYSLAKQSGKYEGKLRYPAEDSRYEREKMDKLGL